MSWTEKFENLLADPPPDFGFEISEAGLAWSTPKGRGFTPFEPGTLRATPFEENILRPDNIARAIREVTGDPRPGRRRKAALIVPDHSCRTAVLDFDTFPSGNEEQNALLKFRMRKSVPFDIETASMAFQAQPRADGKKVDVIVSLMALDNLARYEAPFRAAGLHVGLVSPAALSMLACLPRDGCRVAVKLSAGVLTIAALIDGALRLLRTIDLLEDSPSMVDDHLLPTLTFMEDEWGRRPETIHLVAPLEEWASHWQGQGLPVETMPSPYGKAAAWNAGLLGFLAGGGRS